MRFRGVVSTLALLLVVALAGAAWAQEQSGGIQGVVRDSSGAVLPGVTVEARNVSAAGAQSVVTDDRGVYRFPALPPGTYEVTASLQGFNPAKITNAIIVLGKLLTIDLALTVASVSETVQVIGESPIIDIKQNATFATVQAEAIARIPKGRDFTSVIVMAAGANDESRAGGTSINGASGSENRYIVDGIDTTNLRTGVSEKRVVNEWVAEVQVKTSGYNAEFGGATGGVVSAVTKSGSNQFRGSASFYFGNNDSLRGKVRPSLRLLPTNTTQAEYYKLPLDKIPEYQPVFEIGGPILKDSLWFYGGYAPVRTSTTRTVTFVTAPADGSSKTQTFVQDNPVDRVTATLSGQLGNKLRFKLNAAPSWSKSRKAIPSIEPNGTSTADPNIDRASVGRNDWNHSYSTNLDYMASNKLYVSLMGGYFLYDGETLGNGTAILHSFGNTNNMYPQIPANLIQPSGFVDGKSSNKTVRDKYARLFVNATTTWFVEAGGQHTVKLGGRYERIGEDVLTGQLEPTITLNWDTPYNRNDTGESVRGTYGHFVVSKGVVVTANIHSNNWGFFLQDSWAVNSRLTINAGVRTESEKVPYYSAGAEGQGLDFGFSKKIAPRLGFAWDVAGDGKWKAYGSFGRYFDITKLEMPRGSFGGEKWISYAWTLDTYDWTKISCQEGRTGCPGTFVEQTIWRFGSNEVDPSIDDVRKKYFGTSGNWIDPDIKPVQSQAVSLGLDHELSPVMSVGARYTHTWVTRTIEDAGWNEPGLGEFYIIGNPGDGAFGDQKFLWGPDKLYKTGTFVPMPKPIRKYDAIELTFKKRLANNWSGQLVYTFSRLWGNFPGLASSDEGGRTSPNVNRMYDSIWMMYDQSGSKTPVVGLLNTDRPHYVKAQFTYDLPWGTMVGVNWSGRTGALYSAQLSYQGYSPTFYKGRGSLGRTPFEQFVDLLIQQDIRLGKRYTININVNVSNLLDTDTATAIFASPSRDRYTASPPEAFFNGFNFDALMAASPTSYRPDARYKLASSFMGRREIRLGATFRF